MIILPGGMASRVEATQTAMGRPGSTVKGKGGGPDDGVGLEPLTGTYTQQPPATNQRHLSKQIATTSTQLPTCRNGAPKSIGMGLPSLSEWGS